MVYHHPIKEYIFKQPQPFASCHASTLVMLPDGDILAAWFGGSKEGANDVAIWSARRKRGTWSPPGKVADQESVPHWNPVLFQAKSGKIFLFYKVGHAIPTWQTWLTTSDDMGYTWRVPRELVPGDHGGRGPVKNKPIRRSDGTWLAPASTEGEMWEAFVDISHDQGRTWTKSQTVRILPTKATPSQPGQSFPQVPDLSLKGKGVIQPTLWESAPGEIHMLLRSTQGRIFRSDSHDGGQTWCAAYPTPLPNNNSGIDLTQLPNSVLPNSVLPNSALPNGDLVLAYNPVGENWGRRPPPGSHPISG